MNLPHRYFILVATAALAVSVVYAATRNAPTPKKSQPPTFPSSLEAHKKSSAATTSAVTHVVQVRNDVTKEMTGYRRMGKTWYPDEYSIRVNGTIVEPGACAAITCHNKSLKISFAYDFRPMGTSYKKGTEDRSYHVSDDTKEVAITFSWKEEPRIIVVAALEPQKKSPLMVAQH